MANITPGLIAVLTSVFHFRVEINLARKHFFFVQLKNPENQTKLLSGELRKAASSKCPSNPLCINQDLKNSRIKFYYNGDYKRRLIDISRRKSILGWVF